MFKRGHKRRFDGSAAYWESRYQDGGNSGAGSYDQFAAFKAEFINAFVKKESIESVIEFGCGDGNQLSLLDVPDYVGVDVSKTAIEQCEKRFADDSQKRFLHSDAPRPGAQLALSLDVIYHLVEDSVYETYLSELFAAAEKFVIVYSSNDSELESSTPKHVRHRCFTDSIDKLAPGWSLIEKVPNRYPYLGDYRTGSFADFYVFGRSK